ncbi:MAG: recombinase family protein [Bacteroidetes bacterium]|uniref:Recombinase family protein n=1 Tax=Candidatus Chlorohelix allophototropha TaxID=3003348 RepID=A0A8T7M6G5_9CHLR|nr:recombinase family protein [Chloroflexota bacterium]NWJ53458.1 recombinase family protein [Bacteroidota bacterium]WJW69151.1 recombinase family protein [Chloroflexota bacterium L227-S17]WJW69590.1 recombinase family protein [Chloroflexota bacterium L227-S17]
MLLSQLTSSKITPQHFNRQALIYVRQSTLAQVRQNTGSTSRQYDLKQRALKLGWQPECIIIIDDDLGRSGTSALNRDGFQWLVAQVGLGLAGAVLCLEASRLARSCSDWYRLLEICALTDTLVIDEEGVYDPGQYNDRLLLGFKGTMSEAELHWIRQRMDGGKLAKAQKGELQQPLPVGLVYDPLGRIVLDPDEQIAGAVRLVFNLFDQYGSALAVVRHFNQQGLKFPTRPRLGSRESQHQQFLSQSQATPRWEPLKHGRVRSILHNPFYAGAYVYGRLRQIKTVETQKLDSPTKTRLVRLKPSEWPIVFLEHHPGYITWLQFLKNEQQLDQNRTYRFEERAGAIRKGAALLQGLLRCGKCGRRMRVNYLGNIQGPLYVCNEERIRFGGNMCQTIRGDGIDEAVARCFLAALQLAQLEISLAAIAQLETQAQQFEQQWKLSLERAEYEANLAQRRFMAVEPENRLVARSLEKDWNEKLARLEKLQQEYLAKAKLQAEVTSLSGEEREKILALAQNVPAVWYAATTTQAERKQLLRFLIKSVTLLKREEEGTVDLDICWQTEAHTVLKVKAPVLSCNKYRTDINLLDKVRQLAVDHTDGQILQILNEQGWKNSHGQPLSVARVRGIRRDFGIFLGSPERPGKLGISQRSDGRYTVEAVAKILQVDPSTVNDWCVAGRLDNVQLRKGGTRWIKLSSEEIAELGRSILRHKHKRN